MGYLVWRCCDTGSKVAALIIECSVPNKQGGSFSNDGTRYVLKDGSTFNSPYGCILINSSNNVPEEVINYEIRIFKVMKNGKFRPQSFCESCGNGTNLRMLHLAAKQKHTLKDVPKSILGRKCKLGAVQSNGMQMAKGEFLNAYAQ